MRKIRAILNPLSRVAIPCAGAATMWWLGTSWVPVVAWLVMAWAALAIDPRGGGRFLTVIIAATLLVGLWAGIEGVAVMPDQVARHLLFEFAPVIPTILRPMVVALFFWTLIAGLVAGGVAGVARRSWRRSLVTVVAGVCSVVVFAILMGRWAGMEEKHQKKFPPLGVAEIFALETGPVDLAEVVAVPAALPVPPFEVRKGLSYGPHGYRNTLDLYLPKEHGSRLPVVVYIHGGGAMRGGTDDDQGAGLPEVWLRALLSRKLAVANINYRLVFADPDSRHDEITGPFPSQIQDCLAAVRFLRAEAPQFGLDPDRIGAMGHSFGGGLAALVGLASDREEFLTETRRGVNNRVQAVADCAGLNDVRIWGNQMRHHAKLWNLPTADYLDNNEFARKYFAITGDFDPASAPAANASAITHVRPGAPPFLQIDGFRDVLAVQADLLHEHLKQVGATSRLIVIPGAGHSLADVPGTGEVMAEFLREKLTK